MIKKCACGRDYVKDEPWKTRCISCWKASKGIELTSVEALNAKLRNENAQLRAAQGSVPIPAEQLRRLIQLCHPDRHSGSTAANEVTQWLIKIYKKVGGS